MESLDREFFRGEVYYAQYNDSFGTEMGVGRPVLIIGSDDRNKRDGMVVALYLSSSENRAGHISNVEVKSTSRRSWVMCNQVTTVDKRRLGTKMCSLTAAEMESVDAVLKDCLGLSDESDDEERQYVEQKLNDEIISQRMEIEMWQKLYEAAINQVVSVKLAADVNRITMDRERRIPEQKEDVDFDLIDINHCNVRDLRDLGFDATVAHNILSQRPYKYVDDIRYVEGVTQVAWMMVKDKICCVVDAKQEPQKINVNTATVEEIMAGLGVGKDTAYSITGYRKKNGPFRSLEDLLKTTRFGPKLLEKHRAMLTV